MHKFIHYHGWTSDWIFCFRLRFDSLFYEGRGSERKKEYPVITKLKNALSGESCPEQEA